MTLIDLLFSQDFLANAPDVFYDFFPVVVLFGVLGILLLVGVPIAFSIGIAAMFTVFIDFPIDKTTILVSQKLANGLDNFGLLALPFFIVAGNLMNRGGLAARLINFAMLFGGRLPGSLSHVNVIANMLFGSLSGSAVASAAAVGGIMKPLQKKHNYPMDFSTAVNVASCPSGLLIPPSNILILFALVSSTSVQYLFIAGYIPGIMMGLGIMIGIMLLGKRYNIPREKIVFQEKTSKVIWDALPSLGLVVIIMGGILAGIFTATEASAIAVVYALILGIAYRELKLDDMMPLLIESVVTTSIVLLMVATSSAMSWSMANADIPTFIADFVMETSTNPIVVILLMNVILLVIGTFMDMTPAVLIFTPIFLPIAMQLGIDPVHFGIILVFNLCIGICTPPVGTALFVGCSVSEMKLGQVVPKLLPLFLIMIATLALVTLFPSLSLWLPGLAGYKY
ncbi:Sialic acid TRAP transporter permease protein SiaT [Vibrio aerogenes CECT 7868]|uniref:TRAP transporter large permease protein n=1 Tax=Vibrio aerogenes CECT 7868 TaxID=1216006 RepID=A0A1M5XR77_9VIBR|nr:TRAP transporter large permease subunit [Vibrio aerogenes]SHI02259.1 Sialic acid TRAP transporter permease protein SiaT [Vibrio aerogenes CECT 7868]